MKFLASKEDIDSRNFSSDELSVPGGRGMMLGAAATISMFTRLPTKNPTMIDRKTRMGSSMDGTSLQLRGPDQNHGTESCCEP